MLLLEAKPEDDNKFFTDSKGKVHPLEPSKEATAYAKKMGFKHTIGGKSIFKDKDLRKVIAKNVLNDAIVGASGGGIIGATHPRSGKGALLGALAGGAVGGIWGVGEGITKYKILNKLSNEEKAKLISSPKYKAGNLASIGAYTALSGLALKALMKRSLSKEAIKLASGADSGLAKKALKGDLTELFAKKATSERGKKFGLENIKKHFLSPKDKATIAKTVENPKYVNIKAKKMADDAKSGAKEYGGAVFPYLLGTAGAAIVGDAADEAASSKAYGPDKASWIEGEKLYTKNALKTGMYSGKKYTLGGMGTEVGTKQQQHRRQAHKKNSK